MLISQGVAKNWGDAQINIISETNPEKEDTTRIDFSKQECRTCGCQLAGERYWVEAAWFDNLEQELDDDPTCMLLASCGDCIAYFANGEDKEIEN